MRQLVPYFKFNILVDYFLWGGESSARPVLQGRTHSCWLGVCRLGGLRGRGGERSDGGLGPPCRLSDRGGFYRDGRQWRPASRRLAPARSAGGLVCFQIKFIVRSAAKRPGVLGLLFYNLILVCLFYSTWLDLICFCGERGAGRSGS